MTAALKRDNYKTVRDKMCNIQLIAIIIFHSFVDCVLLSVYKFLKV